MSGSPPPPFILIANHSSYLDWILLDCFINKTLNQKVHIIAKRKLLKNPIWRLMIWYRKAIVVDGTPNQNRFKEMFETLHNGEILVVFPEGMRAPSKDLLRFQKGFAYLAVESKVPVVPVGLVGFYDNWPRQRLLPKLWPVPMEIRIGKPIDLHLNCHQSKEEIMKSLISESRETIERLLQSTSTLRG
ncbi:MAG: lysophospholipid acyltransferase family protein [Proteobacteria bacterium]|nr:lysophospholipid acyltransferase family protein [Pseudomonadota bacterium]